MSGVQDLTAAVKAAAMEAGFARVGIAPAGPVSGAERFGDWLARGGCGEMHYLKAHLQERLNPQSLVPGAQSVICLAVGYAPPAGEGAPAAPAGLVARYARGRDYHRLLKRRCLRLMDRLRAMAPTFQGRAFVDSAPVMERSLAARAGVGWIGRNGCLSAPGLGSYLLLCEILCNLPLAADEPLPCGCQGCDACVRACPTGALAGDGLMDARRCVSYLTVEQRGAVAPAFWPRMGVRVFGCDRCQEVCPHNRDVPPGDPALSGPRPPLGGATLADILGWSAEDWDSATRGSACRRATWAMFLRNAAIAAGNSGEGTLLGPLGDLGRRRPELADLTAWGVKRLRRLPRA